LAVVYVPQWKHDIPLTSLDSVRSSPMVIVDLDNSASSNQASIDTSTVAETLAVAAN